MTFRREGGACLSSTVRKKSQNWFAFSTDENVFSIELLLFVATGLHFMM